MPFSCKSCCVCGTVSEKSDANHIAFFRFPKEKELKEKWLLAVKMKNVFKYSKICERHFKAEDISAKQKKRLKKGAIPSLNLNSGSPPSQEHEHRAIKYHNSYRKCVICEHRGSDRGYFSFPVDLKERIRWLRLCDRPTSPADEMITRAKICSAHFSTTDVCYNEFGSTKRKYKLRPKAVPFQHGAKKSNNFTVNNEKPEKILSTLGASITSTSETPSAESADTSIENIYVDEYEILSVESPSTSPTPICDSSLAPQTSSSKKHRLAYIGDITTADLATPERASRCLDVANKEVLRLRKKVIQLQNKVRFLNKKVAKYESARAEPREESIEPWWC